MSLIQQIFAIPFSLRQKRIAKVRPKIDEEEFVARIVKFGGDGDAARIIHKKLNNWVYIREFTPYPDDDLGIMYGIAEEELDEDIVLDLLNVFELTRFGLGRVSPIHALNTPIDIARFIKAARASAPDD